MKKETLRQALVLIDVINDFDFENGESLLRYALPAAKSIARLKKRAKKHGIPVIYVNDNFGHWQSDFREQIRRCLSAEAKGREVVSLLLPDEDDYFVLKPKHSGFYSTPLQVLLGHLQIECLILTGFAADICVIYTANDAYMRDYRLIVPEDCVASESAERARRALSHMRRLLKANISKASSLRF
ncbi:MAG: isochorismatase family cysteine hydrolase [Luteolibacter sp.]